MNACMEVHFRLPPHTVLAVREVNLHLQQNRLGKAEKRATVPGLAARSPSTMLTVASASVCEHTHSLETEQIEYRGRRLSAKGPQTQWLGQPGVNVLGFIQLPLAVR